MKMNANLIEMSKQLLLLRQLRQEKLEQFIVLRLRPNDSFSKG